MDITARSLRTPVILTVLIAILAGLAYWGYHNVLAPLPGREKVQCVEQPVKELRTDQVNVRVFNAGGNRQGLARTTAKQMKAVGFRIAAITNSDEFVDTTVIIGARPDSPEVKLVASFFNKPILRGDDRDDGSVDLLAGVKFQPPNSAAKRSIPVPEGTACIAPAPSATPTPTTKPSGK